MSKVTVATQWPMDTWGLMGLLAQAEVWINVQNEAVPLSEIDARYAVNIVSLMEHNAPVWKDMVDRWYTTTIGPTGEMAQMAFDEECERQWNMTPIEWLSARPLYKAIKELSNG